MERFTNIQKHLATYVGSGEQPVFTDAHGARYIDESGNEYLCLNEISCILGLKHPRFTTEVSELVKTQLLCHAGTFSEAKEKLIQNFMSVTHGDFDKIMIAGSGGETVDWSIKLARRYTGKDGIISFRKALHGRSFAGAFLSDTPTRKEGFGSGLEHTYFWDYPGDGRNCEPTADDYQDIAAIIIEPYQALSGMDSPGTEYWKWLRAYTKEHGILLIMDEIQTGFGKTGSFFAYEETGIVPDILLAGKGMSNGFGLGAMLITKEIASCIRPQQLSGGSADNPLMCSIVNLVFDIIREEKLLQHVTEIRRLLEAELQRILGEAGIRSRFYGKGLFFSVDLPEGVAEVIWEEARKHRIMMGKNGTRIVMRTPLVLSEEDVFTICEMVRQAISR